MKNQSYFAIHTFNAFLRSYRPKIIGVLLIFAVSSALISVVPLAIGKLVEAAATGNTTDIWTYAWILVILSSLHDILWRAGEFIHRRIINPLSFLFETELFRHVITRPYPYFINKLSGKISSSVTTISTEFRNLLAQLAYSYTSQIISIITMGILLGTANWQTLVIFIIGIAGMILVGRHTVRNSTKYEARATDVQSTKNGHIVDSIANFSSVKSFHKEQQEIAIVKAAQKQSINASQAAYFWGIMFWGSMSFFIRHIIWPATILVNVALYFDGQISLGQLATVFSTILLFSSSIWGLIWETSQFNLQMARIEEAYKYLFGSKTLTFNDTHSKVKSVEFKESITLNHLTFSYPDQPDSPILNDFSLSIRKGEKIGIVGKSGGGKTTLVKLLLGYYDLPGNTMTVDGIPTTIENFAQNIAYVPQDTSLFHRTIKENIAYAASGTATNEEIMAAAKKAYAHEFIMNIEHGYDALVGERGVKLSGGQRQRIAIARAMLKKSPLLILDEATSALDSESELHIQRALWELMSNRTAIVIAHRLSTIQKMDRIIVLDNGRIVEEGTHEELLKKQNAYATLWMHQSGGFIKE